ncbi:6317_t:CDS:1 [Dentiscutata heterogama]|uniref:6317_t:CDS:1 n=1 Tax=Dentiscutata heterogama TaxID=1316150 RepID=A0ACA9N111_9GLOM|nr:6317_t:CDS:1 [Dentiscutata heterogama]
MATTNEGSEFNINSPFVIALVVIIIAVVVIGVIVVVFLILRYQNKSASTKTRGLKTRIGPESRDNGHTHKKRDSTGMIFDLEGKEESFEESYAEGAVGHQQQQTSGRSLPVRSQTIYGSQPPSTSTIALQSSTIQVPMMQEHHFMASHHNNDDDDKNY